ncbi:D-TA family PLP-dependent enzyme [Niabella beijingensis]|uniref:D-TA family PLP-dependent enzyme n=1 Tax=Niabella beijingensis TaxID=2872700 RepID=UPI001CBD68B9|nr:D-TA family PLP-dependent enzyme [Niabella beijingensis]MBZ4190056.1 D-TA family PLP-dependent enzyme [Niabella beijingensis]
MEEQAWYTIRNADTIDTPALVLYPDRIRENIDAAVEMLSRRERLRPHVKTHKSAEVIKLLLAAGIQRFKCATLAEAALLADTGARDILLAYPPTAAKLSRWLELVRKFSGVTFSCLVDNTGTGTLLSEAAQKAGITLLVYIDLNVGMDRTGIKPDAGALELYETLTRMPGLRVEGLHAYDGHINETEIAQRQNSCTRAFAPVYFLQTLLKERGYPQVNVIAGGSPTFSVHAATPDVECSPGTFVYWDKGYQELLPDLPFIPAALVLARIISLPTPDQVCIDLGYKSIAAEQPIGRRVFFLNAPGLKMLRHSEEHLVAETAPNHQWKIGDLLYGLPWHICPTVALYQHAEVIVGGVKSGVWPVAGKDYVL